MATGSGKTISALSIASRLYDALDGRSLAILIVAPFVHLIDQWMEVGAAFGLRPIRCAEGAGRWHDELATAIFANNAGHCPVLSVAVTSATLQSAEFQRLLRRVRAPFLVIGDEAHNYGTPKLAASLPAQA
jgi:superfamily II DNA or RNA helicase